MIDTQPITRRRGDTYRIRIGFTQDDGTPLPLDGTFRLVVTEQSAPSALDPAVMELDGAIVGDPLDGIVDFQQTLADADNVGDFFFEVENTTAAGDIRTILEGPFTMVQDRAKNEFDETFVLDSFGPDGTKLLLDGNDTVFVTSYWNAPGDFSLEAGTRDTRRTVRFISEVGSNYSPGYIELTGTASPVRILRPWLENIEVTALAYVDNAGITAGIHSIDGYGFFDATVRHDPIEGTRASLLDYEVVPGPAQIWEAPDGAWNAAGVPGWFYVKLLLEKDFADLKAKYWKLGDDEPAAWDVSVVPTYKPRIGVKLHFLANYWATYAGTEIADVAEYRVHIWK